MRPRRRSVSVSFHMAIYPSTSSTILPFALVLMLTSISLTWSMCQVESVFYRRSRTVDYLGGHGASFFDKLHCSHARHRRPAPRRRAPHPRMAPTPAHDAARSGARCRDFGTTLELPRNGQGATLSRDGAASLRTPRRPAARAQYASDSGRLCAGIRSAQARRSCPLARACHRSCLDNGEREPCRCVTPSRTARVAAETAVERATAQLASGGACATHRQSAGVARPPAPPAASSN